MTDVIDAGSTTAEFFEAVAARNQALQANLKHNAKFMSLTHCERCGNEIPLQRQQAINGCATCIECERYLELKFKQTGR